MARPITEQDLVAYVAGECEDHEIRARITRQLDIPGSPIRKWMDAMDAKLADPFNVDWVGLCCGEADEREEGASKEAHEGRKDCGVRT